MKKEGRYDSVAFNLRDGSTCIAILENKLVRKESLIKTCTL